MRAKFIVDTNVGKLARWLRIMGYDALYINDIDDEGLINIALKEKRVLLTRDTQIMLRRVVTSGRLKALLIEGDNPKAQLRQVVTAMKLDQERNFTLCLECNEPLAPRSKEEVKDLVPPYVFKTQSQYVQCPVCHRVYWRGTHWQRMKKELETLFSPFSNFTLSE
ncbi:MAG: Mut7-C RNAse domain-containing protein [Dehalococcoidia bacterium]|nr:Mut7-C RNAse domain-containing protein [Dehalococcoidia bacterium]